MLSDAERCSGITTIDEKLENECPGYERMSVLFGHRQSMNASHTMQNGDDSDQDNEEEDPANGVDLQDEGDGQDLYDDDDYEIEEDDLAMHGDMTSPSNNFVRSSTLGSTSHPKAGKLSSSSTEVANSIALGNRTTFSSLLSSVPKVGQKVGRTSSSDNLPKPKISRNTTSSSKESKGIDVDLIQMSKDMVEEAASKGDKTIDLKKGGVAGKKDFSTTWAEGNKITLELNNRRFEWDKNMMEVARQDRKEKELADSLAEDRRNEREKEAIEVARQERINKALADSLAAERLIEREKEAQELLFQNNYKLKQLDARNEMMKMLLSENKSATEIQEFLSKMFP